MRIEIISGTLPGCSWIDPPRYSHLGERRGSVSRLHLPSSAAIRPSFHSFPGFPARLLLVLLALASIAGCGGEPGVEALSGVQIDLAVDPSGVDACRIERTARIDQDTTPLYMLRGEASYSSAGQPVRRIPIQVQFRGVEGVVTDRAVTLTELPVDCAEVSIEMVIEECISIERSATACPPIEVSGQEGFAALRWTLEE